jgi:hypothetical protein
MTTIRNTNERFGDPAQFSGETLADAVAAMQATIRECGPEFSDVVVTDCDYEVIDAPNQRGEMMKTSGISNGYFQHTFPHAGSPGITAIGNAVGDEGGDDRIEVRTTDDAGRNWRVFIERDPAGGFAITEPEMYTAE